MKRREKIRNTDACNLARDLYTKGYSYRQIAERVAEKFNYTRVSRASVYRLIHYPPKKNN